MKRKCLHIRIKIILYRNVYIIFADIIMQISGNADIICNTPNVNITVLHIVKGYHKIYL